MDSLSNTLDSLIIGLAYWPLAFLLILFIFVYTTMTNSDEGNFILDENSSTKEKELLSLRNELIAEKNRLNSLTVEEYYLSAQSDYPCLGPEQRIEIEQEIKKSFDLVCSRIGRVEKKFIEVRRARLNS